MNRNKIENKILKIKSLKGNSMIRKIMVLTVLLSVAAFAEEEGKNVEKDNLKASRIETLENGLAKIISKAGIHFGGEFRSQFVYSSAKSDADGDITSNVDSLRASDEGVEYTSVDLDITARPHSAASGRVLIRLHQDWRNFFSALKSPISARWMSMDGVIADMFRYNVGDFRQKYSPLFMWSPDMEIDFEPEIFAKHRRMAMNEAFLGNNERILQGINLNFDAEVDPVFDEFHINLMGARLRSSGVRPEKGGNAIVGEMEAAMFDRYALGINTDMTIIPDIDLGISFMDIWDDKNTYKGDTVSSKNDFEVLRDRTFIIGGRLGLGTANFLDPKKLNFNLNGEVAISLDDSTYYKDTINLESTSIVGLALRGGLDAKFGIEGAKGNINLSADFIRNEEDYRNELAQSPTFIDRSRILNVENDLAEGNLYSTFDALYRHVFKFSPSKTLGDETSNGFYKAPTQKNSYTHSVLTKEDMNTVNTLDDDGYLDSLKINTAILNLAMPYGPATPNRTGADIDLDIDFLEKAIIIKGDFTLLNTVKDLESGDTSVTTENSQSFIEFGGGASLDLARLGDWWKYPFILSGGYKHTIKSNDYVNEHITDWKDVTSQFINAGLYFTFWKRASFLGGFQLLNTNFEVLTKQDIDFNQMHWAAGLEWKVTENGTLTGSFGQIYLETSIGDGSGVLSRKAKEHINQVDLYLTVNF